MHDSAREVGAADRNRTRNLLFTKQLLCQLSYGGDTGCENDFEVVLTRIRLYVPSLVGPNILLLVGPRWPTLSLKHDFDPQSHRPFDSAPAPSLDRGFADSGVES